MRLRDATQELIELGPRGTLFRMAWEVKTRAILPARKPRPKPSGTESIGWTSRLQFEDPITLARALAPRIPEGNLSALRAKADDAVLGRILCFGRWTADFGNPIDWHRNPVTGQSWKMRADSFRALGEPQAGDVKYCWEVARFPHAYHLARAASFFPDRAEAYAAALSAQIEQFAANNPVGVGVHWASGQEVGFRLLAWLFALDVLLQRTSIGGGFETAVARALADGAAHIERHLDYARIAVYNNHLLSEALALFAVGVLLSEAPSAMHWRDFGRAILEQEAERQFYHDGGYIQQSHNYHRVALQDYLWACSFARAMGDRPPDAWLRALERSLDLLTAHQNPVDGRLPNYGLNDGALPSILSTCDFADMRPTLQAVSVLVRGERLYEPGPWDEETAWFFGVRALDAPLRKPERRSVSFSATGYHVLHGRESSSFCTFRCGSLRDRFSQIDMLHLDVWWRGQNVLVDAGSFQYNAAPKWHEHFMSTAAHNTVTIDGRDQMVHHRQFKVLYWTRANMLRFEDGGAWTLCEGEHYGYRRHQGRAVHRRSVLFAKDDLWVVVDRIVGDGRHRARLHWLGGDFPLREIEGGMALATPEGEFSVRVFDEACERRSCDVVAGADDPPQGWLSRYYGEKVAVPSLAAECDAPLPLTFITVLSGAPCSVAATANRWTIGDSHRELTFRLRDGSIVEPSYR